MNVPRASFPPVGSIVLLLVAGACAGSRTAPGTRELSASRAIPAVRSAHAASPGLEQVLRGRLLAVTHGCVGCHGGGANPEREGYLAGSMGVDDDFLIGPCATKPGATPCYRTRPRNLTPDNATGLGRFSERQIFNALRFGLRPGETPDVEITSMVPGEGNFPVTPKYLAPPMPWPEWRHMADQDLWDIAAYLKHGLKPVHNRVADSEGPADFWASAYTPARIGPYPLPPYPTVREVPRAQLSQAATPR